LAGAFQYRSVQCQCWVGLSVCLSVVSVCLCATTAAATADCVVEKMPSRVFS